MRLKRPITDPIREGLNWDQLWLGEDRGLIWCWERGRQKRNESPDLAARAESGELVILAWKGGVEEKLSQAQKIGTLSYLATWQGLRNESLDIDPDGQHLIVCSRTGQAVLFKAGAPPD